MPKKFFEDMAKGKRSQRMTPGRVSVSPERPAAPLRRPPEEEEPEEMEISPEWIPEIEKTEKKFKKRGFSSRKKARSRYGLWLLAGIALIFLFFAVSLLFSKAEITIKPETETLSLNGNFSASKDKSAAGLSFDLVSLSGDESKVLQGGEEKQVSVPAAGTVLIYNDYSASPQTLDVNTRLEGSNGKIYKTDKKITVPGLSAGAPGSVEVGIHASMPGADYNSSPLDFKIVGFKGSPKYDKFYGRSKGQISGGFQGTSVAISDGQKSAALAEMKDSLKASLLKKASGQIPAGFILWKDAVFLEETGEDLKPADSQGSATYTLHGTLYGFLFPEAEITKEIVQKTMSDYDGSDVNISNLKDLSFSLANAGSVDFATAGTISFSLSGSPSAVYKFDSNKLISDVLGRNKSDFKQIMSKYPHVASADLSIQPVWRQSFPERASEITVKVNYPASN